MQHTLKEIKYFLRGSGSTTLFTPLLLYLTQVHNNFGADKDAQTYRLYLRGGGVGVSQLRVSHAHLRLKKKRQKRRLGTTSNSIRAKRRPLPLTLVQN